jgi:hypothetical protein
MALADLLLGADPGRERWVWTGASMVVIDTPLHNHLHRTGTLRRFGAEHPYGPRCYAPGGCADIIRGLAERVDAREFNSDFPACFPRFVQFAVWRLCSASELDVCNGTGSTTETAAGMRAARRSRLAAGWACTKLPARLRRTRDRRNN